MLALFFALLSVALAATPFPTAVSVPVAPGAALTASIGLPKQPQGGVVFVHMAGRNKEDWQFLADRLYRQGTAVLALDLRGHGGNLSGAPAVAVPASDPHVLVADVAAAVAWLRAKGIERIALVGAELGANVAINVAVDDPKIASVVLLSPGMEYRGVIASDAVQRYGARPLLLVASKDDPYAARSAAALDATARGEHAFQLYDAAGKGTRMLVVEPTLAPLVAGFITRRWATPAEAPPPKGIQIEVPAGPTSTGPTEMPGG